MLSHEIRTPLTSIVGGADLLGATDRALSDPVRREVLEHVRVEAARLHRLVEDFLVLSSPPPGPEAQEPIPIGALVRQVLSDVAPRIGRRRLRASVAPGLPPATGDPARVTRALRNLVEIALGASPERGLVEVVAGRRDGRAVVRVIDHAPARSPSRAVATGPRSAPFEEATWRTPAPGGGLGLAATRSLVEATGGHLWTRPRYPVGHELGFDLPLLRVPEESEEPHGKA